MTTIAIIPARGGSKGIKRKNIYRVGGHPLIFYQISNAYLASKIDYVFVSSEDDWILEVAKEVVEKHFGTFQTKIRFIKRPAELAEDDVMLEPVIDHVLREVGFDVDVVCVLQPTSPLLTHKYIDWTLHLLENDTDMDSIFTASEFHGFIWEKNNSNVYNYRTSLYGKRIRRQEMRPRYLENGALYAFEVDTYRVHKTMLHGNIGMQIMPKSMSPEVDDFEDIKIIEAIMKTKAIDKLKTEFNL